MRFLLRNHFENAHQSLKANRGRTGLTIIGTAIGIAGITFVLSISHGISELLNHQAIAPTKAIAVIHPGTNDTPLNSILQPSNATYTNTLTEKDVQDLTKLPNTTVTPLAVAKVGLSTNDKKLGADKVTLVGSTGSLKQIASLSMLDGQFIDEANGIVMGSQLSVDLFGTENSLGSVLYVRGEPMTVVGVLAPTDTPINYLGINLDNSAIISLPKISQFTSGVTQVQQIILTTDNKNQLDEAVSASEKILSQNHRGDHDFHILTGNQITEPTNELVQGVFIAILIIAGISILAGGIGIMNIMLVNVAERQREVGIRKAVGATRQAIINQFLVESAIIGLIGGAIGYLIGMVSAYVTSLFLLPVEPAIDWKSPIVAIILSILVGVIFGIYPAILSARKNPIESLRL